MAAGTRTTAAKDLGGEGAACRPSPRSFAAMLLVPATIPAAQDDSEGIPSGMDTHFRGAVLRTFGSWRLDAQCVCREALHVVVDAIEHQLVVAWLEVVR